MILSHHSTRRLLRSSGRRRTPFIVYGGSLTKKRSYTIGQLEATAKRRFKKTRLYIYITVPQQTVPFLWGKDVDKLESPIIIQKHTHFCCRKVHPDSVKGVRESAETTCFKPRLSTAIHCLGQTVPWDATEIGNLLATCTSEIGHKNPPDFHRKNPVPNQLKTMKNLQVTLGRCSTNSEL